MNLQEGDTFELLSGGIPVPPSHPFVILLVKDSSVYFSNITDIEKEDFVDCVLHPTDDPAIITKKSTFRYQSIRETPLLKIESAFKAQQFRHRGQITKAAFDKIKAGIHKSKLIKPAFRKILQDSIEKPIDQPISVQTLKAPTAQP